VQHLGKLVLGQRKVDGDGLELVDDHQVGGVGGDDVAGVHQPQADFAVDGRLDRAPVELQLGGLDGRLVGFDGALVLALVASSASSVSFETTPAS
jgi:hypothetical protein